MQDHTFHAYYVPSQLRIETLHFDEEGIEVHVLGLRLLQLRELAVAVDKGGQARGGGVDAPDARFEGRTDDVITTEQTLTDAGDGCRGVHDLVGEHTCQAFPRLDLALVHLLMNHFAQVVHHLLHRPLAAGQATRIQAERPVAIADGLTHQVGTATKGALVANKEE